jgi:hypothetical protein
VIDSLIVVFQASSLMDSKGLPEARHKVVLFVVVVVVRFNLVVLLC